MEMTALLIVVYFSYNRFRARSVPTIMMNINNKIKRDC